VEFSRRELSMLLNQGKPLWLMGADLSGAKHDVPTKWPKRFDPQQARAVLVEQ
jgi:hypothetical protein